MSAIDLMNICSIIAFIIMLIGFVASISTWNDGFVIGAFICSIAIIFIFGTSSISLALKEENERQNEISEQISKAEILAKEADYQIYLSGQEISIDAVNLENYNIVIDNEMKKIILTEK